MQLFMECFLCCTTSLVFTRGIGISLLSGGVRRGVRLSLLCILLLMFSSCGAVAAYLLAPYLQSETADLFRPLLYLSASAVPYLLLLAMTRLLPIAWRSKMATALQQVACSSVVMGVCLLAPEAVGSLKSALQFGFRCGIGTCLAGLALSAAEPLLTNDKIPAASRGWPAQLMYLGILSMAVACLI